METMTASPSSVKPTRSHYSGVCHGTVGELFQGPYIDGNTPQIAIISLPVRRYSWAHYSLFPDSEGGGLEDRSRCLRAIDLFLQRHGVSLPAGRWCFATDLLRGKGMASSTADIVATIRCLDAIFGTQSADIIPAILKEIERSDSVFLQTHALYLSGVQKIVARLPFNPSFQVCFIDEGNVIDTEAMGERLLAHYTAKAAAYASVLEEIVGAFARGDALAIAGCATRSAILGQDVLPKQSLEPMLARQTEFGADGLVVAHTGSLIGYLFRSSPEVQRVGELSAFFLELGYQCQCIQSGF
ncbi:MAG: hypothetical protein P8Y58_04315 [Novosphingobium sp.]